MCFIYLLERLGALTHSREVGSLTVGLSNPAVAPNLHTSGAHQHYIVNHYLYKDDVHPATGTIRLATQEGPLEILHPSPSG